MLYTQTTSWKTNNVNIHYVRIIVTVKNLFVTVFYLHDEQQNINQRNTSYMSHNSFPHNNEVERGPYKWRTLAK